MPSLLDYMVSRRNPRLAGILGTQGQQGPAGVLGRDQPMPQQQPIPNQQQVPSPQPPPMIPQQQVQQEAAQQLQARQARQQGVGRNREPGPGEKGQSFLAKLFTGSRIEGLKREEQENLVQPAMIRAGLTMLAAPVGTPWPQALAAGILAGRQEATQTAGTLLDEKRAQQRAIQYRQVFADTDLSEIEQWREARKIAAKRGDTDSIKVFNSVLEEMESAPDRENWEFQQVNGIPVFVDEENRRIMSLDGELLDELPKPPQNRDEVFKRTDKLADDFRSELGDQVDVANAILAGANAPANAAGDLTLIQSLIRAQDPGATVREADIRNAKDIGGFPAQTQSFIRHFADRGKMDPTVRKAIREELVRIGRDRARGVQPTVQRFQLRARRAGVDPGLFVNPLTQALSILSQGGGASQTGNGEQVSTGAGTSGAPTLFPEDEDEGGI